MSHILQPTQYMGDFDWASWGVKASGSGHLEDANYPYLMHHQVQAAEDHGTQIPRYHHQNVHVPHLAPYEIPPPPPHHRIMLETPQYRSPVDEHLQFLGSEFSVGYIYPQQQQMPPAPFQFSAPSSGKPFLERQRAVTEPRRSHTAPAPERKWLEYSGYKVDRDVRSRNSPEPALADAAEESDEETLSDGGTHVQKRRRRRKASELPRDYHQRRYTCPQCDKLFARPSSLFTHSVSAPR